MTVLTSQNDMSSDSEQLLRRRRDRIRDRRLREGSLISGGILSILPDKIISLYPDELPMAQ